MADDLVPAPPFEAAGTSTSPVTLDPGAGYTTIINTYVVAPPRVEELLHFLIRVTAETIRNVPGFVSASFHVNSDGTQLVNYSQWRSREAIASARDYPGVMQGMREAGQIAASFTPVQFELRRCVTGAVV